VRTISSYLRKGKRRYYFIGRQQKGRKEGNLQITKKGKKEVGNHIAANEKNAGILTLFVKEEGGFAPEK